MGKMAFASGVAATAALMVAAPALAQNGAPLAPGEVLLQLQETGSVIEPIGSITSLCSLSVTADKEAAARSALAKKARRHCAEFRKDRRARQRHRRYW